MLRTLAIQIFAIILIFQISSSQEEDTVAVPTTGEDVEEIQGSLEDVNETLTEMKNTLDILRKIKLTGYLQAQYQTADTAGISSFAGGNFPTNVRSRFQVRRGRLKVNYDNDLRQYVLQIDVTQNGVGIKDAFASIKDPWLRTVSFTAGVFDRPFGFEIMYSSSSRETPERSRFFQTLFPGERELGAKIEILPEMGPWSNFNLRAGLFNGVLPTANENDRNKDFIGRIGYQLPFDDIGLAIDLGGSLYSGKVTNNSKFLFEMDDISPIKRFRVDSMTSNVGNSYGRTYFGGDVQFYYDLPAIGGFAIRGEYLAGQQPGTSSSNVFYNPSAANSPVYIRQFSGWYVNYIQNIGVQHQFLVKYDVFDPNTDAEGSDIGISGSNLSATDIKFSTLGIGWIYHWDATVKFVMYYDIVTNEKVNSSTTSSSLAAFKNDVKDNVLTLRMQYRF